MNNQGFDTGALEKLEGLLSEKPKIFITSHHNPDGDAVGSSLGLYLFLKDQGMDVKCAVPNDFPGFLSWMPGSDEIIVYEKKADPSLIAEAEIIFCLDYNALHRTGVMADRLLAATATKILVDHHPDPDLESFTVAFSDTSASSTAEMVYRLIGLMPGGKNTLSKEIATALFVGIMTDTGSFSYSSNDPDTFRIVADLIGSGIDVEYIHRQVYDNYSENRLRLLGFALSEKLTLVPGLNLAYIALTKSELARFDYQIGDTEGIVNYALSLEGVKIAVLLTEKNRKIRLSIRSKGDLAINDIARDHFSGGGHKNAAGGDSFDTMENTISSLIDVLSEYKDRIRSSSYDDAKQS